MNFAIVGTNFISDRFAEACRSVEGAYPYAVYSRGSDTGLEFAKRHNMAIVYTDYEKMLHDDCVDAVYIASPTMLHKEHAMLAIRHGKAVLCEKMITANLEEFLELKSECEKNDAVLVEAMRCDFDVMLKKLPALINELGGVKDALFDFRQYSSRYDAFLRGVVMNAFDPSMKNSALADIGIYPLHLAVSLFGEPLKIEAKSQFLCNGFEGSGELVLDYESFSVKILYSKTEEGENVSFIECNDGRISFGKVNEPKYLKVSKGADSTLISAPESSSNMADEVREFIRIANHDRKEGKRLLSLSERVMRCVDKIYRAVGINF